MNTNFTKTIEDNIASTLLDLISKMGFSVIDIKEKRKVVKNINTLYSMLSKESQQNLCKGACYSAYQANLELDFMEKYLENQKSISSFREKDKPILSYLFANNNPLFKHYAKKYKNVLNLNEVYMYETEDRSGISVSYKKNLLSEVLIKADSCCYQNMGEKIYPLTIEDLKKIDFLEENRFEQLKFDPIHKNLDHFLNKEAFFNELHGRLYPSIGFNIIIKYIKDYIASYDESILLPYNNYKLKYEKVFSAEQKEKIDITIMSLHFNKFVSRIANKLKENKLQKPEDIINVLENEKKQILDTYKNVSYGSLVDPEKSINDAIASIDSVQWSQMIGSGDYKKAQIIAETIKLHYAISDNKTKDNRTFKI